MKHVETAQFPPRTTISMLLAVMWLMLLWPAAATAQTATEFPELDAGQRIYDTTGTSLTSADIGDLQAKLDDLQSTGANPVVYVRALDATPEETFDQVEALQQSWVRETGADQDTAVAVLINRNPDDPSDARAGVFVGRTYQEGNVPGDEQVAIVEQELIPPLRDGDVFASLSGALDRLTSSIRTGPPEDAFEQWAADAAGSWLPWAAVAVALLGLAAAVALWRSRPVGDRPAQPPTTQRPGDLSPALAGALVAGAPQATAVPATLVDLAGRYALAIEPEREGGTFSQPSVQVRLLDRSEVRDDVEQALWTALERRTDDGGVVASKDLQKLAGSPGPVVDVVREQLRERGWLATGSTGPRAALGLIGVVAAALAFFAFIVTVVSESVWPTAAALVALALLAGTAVTFAVRYPRLSPHGQDAAVPWKAYRDGLKRAAKDGTVQLDLNGVLPDLIAVNLASAFSDQLEEASSSGRPLRAFGATTQPAHTTGANFPMWVAFTSSTSTSSGAGGATVSGGGAGGGGGAAGST